MSEVTKYAQARERVLDMVKTMSPGERIPPERSLSAKFDIARETLRRSLDELAKDGYLDRRLGAGTFVSRPKITKQFRVISFTEDMRQRGFEPSSRMVSSALSQAGARLGKYLKVSPAQDVITIKRLRLADGLPMAIETLSIPCDLVPGLRGEELQNRSFYETLETRYGTTVVATRQTIDATDRSRPVPLKILIEAIHGSGCFAMADCATYEEGLAAAELGCEIVASTLSGYTGGPEPETPDYDLVERLAGHGLRVMAEGRIRTPEQAAAAMARGAWSVTVGSAITRVEYVTGWFVDALEGSS